MSEKGDKKLVIEGPTEVKKKVERKVSLQLMAVLVVVIGIILIGYFSKAPTQQRERPVNLDEEIGIDFSSINEADWATKMQAEMTRMSRTVDAIQRDNETLLRERAQSRREIQALEARLAQEREKRTVVSGDQTPTQSGVVDLGGAVPPPVRPGESGEAPPDRAVPPRRDGSVAPPVAPRDRRGDAVGRQPPMPPDNPSVGVQREEPVVVAGEPMRSGVVAERTFVNNEFAGYLPAGSFSSAVMLHGVDAGASESTRANPQPVIMRIDGNAITPGDSQYDLNACFVIGNAVGELSSERAMIRVSRISCLNEAEGFVLESTVDGFVIDSDGMQGLRGEVVRRSGQLIAKATLAGIAEGFGAIASSAARTNATSITGTQVGGGVFGTQEEVSTSGLFRAGAFGGAQNSASLIADFYLREAESIFPVISVPPGRKISIAFLRGQSLRWQRYDGLFRERLIPE